MNIPNWPVWGEREAELLRQVLESQRWGGYHEFVGRFEKDFAAFQHCEHGVAAVNGTVTLEMALDAAGASTGGTCRVRTPIRCRPRRSAAATFPRC